MSKILCIYHSNCADGFGAAWAVRYALGADNVEFHAGVYQDPPPDVTGRDVVMVDFSYKRAFIEEMGKSAKSILILDHHKSAAEDLADLPLPVSTGPTGPAPADWGFCDVTSGYDRESLHEAARQCNGPPLYALFDMNRSGAGLAWDFFVGGARVPLIDHIEDRDLWRFRLPGTREIQAVVFSHPYDFDVWDGLMARSHADADLGQMIEEGAAIERKHHKDVAELVGICKRRMVIAGHNVPAASLPYTLSSDAGHLMAQGEPFAASYWDTPGGRVFSLRSVDDGLDVSEIAKLYGGGGHARAAGFRIPLDRIGGFEIQD